MTSLTRAAFALVFLLSPMLAQGRIVDSTDSVWSSSAGAQWQLYALEVVVTNDATRESAEGVSQIVSAKGMHSLPGDRCLFCGTDAAGDGRIELWQFSSPNTLTLQDSRVDAGRVYGGIATAAGAIYLLDSGADVLLVGAWDTTSALAGISLSTAAQGAAGNFPDADSWTLTTLGDGSAAMVPYPVGAGMRIVPGVGGLASLVPLTVSGGHDAYAIPVIASEGDVAVKAIAVSNAVFDIVRLGVGVIGVGVGAGVENEVSVPLVEPLVLGEQYVARVHGQPMPTDYAFECVRRYGQSEAFSDGTEMQPFFYLAGATSGNTFNIQLALDSQISPIAAHYTGDLLIGFRLPNDPVVPLPDGRYLLGTSLTQQVSGWVLANTTRGSIVASVPIPLGLTDFVFLVQFVMSDGSDFRLSQIYGAEIK